MIFDKNVINYLKKYKTITDNEVKNCKKYINDLCKININKMSCMLYGWNHLLITFYLNDEEYKKLIINVNSGEYKLYKNNVLNLELIKNIKYDTPPNGVLYKNCRVIEPSYLCMTILNNKYIITGDSDGNVSIFDYTTGFNLSNHIISEASVTCLSTYTYKNKNYLFTGDTFGDLFLYEIANNLGNGHSDLICLGKQSDYLNCEIIYGCPHKYTPPIKKILVFSDIVIVGLGDLKTKEGICEHSINGISYNNLPKSKYIENEILIFKIFDKTLIKLLNLKKKQYILNDINIVDNSLFGYYDCGLIVEWDLNTFEQINFLLPKIKIIYSKKFIISNNNKIVKLKNNNIMKNIIQIDTNNTIKIYQDSLLIKELTGHREKITCLGLIKMNNKNILISGSLDGKIICHNIFS